MGSQCNFINFCVEIAVRVVVGAESQPSVQASVNSAA